MIETERLLDGRAGIRFFGDLHGHLDQFISLAENALAKNLALFSLGDLINKGPNSPACMELAADLHDAGGFDLVAGNHEVAFANWYSGHETEVKRRSLGVTISQLGQASNGKAIARRFHDLVCEAPLWRRFGNVFTVHGGLAPACFTHKSPKVRDHLCSPEARHLALYGERAGAKNPENGKASISWNWAKEIPGGITVLVGHTTLSMTEIIETKNPAGGRVLHLDTGLHGGGKLSFIDIPAESLKCSLADGRLPSFSTAPKSDFAPSQTRDAA